MVEKHYGHLAQDYVADATFPTFEALDRTCKSLRESIGKMLRKAGVMVRL